MRMCVDLQFSKNPDEILSFNAILYRCVGTNFVIIDRFYSEIMEILTEIIKEKIKNLMIPNFCDKILN